MPERAAPKRGQAVRDLLYALNSALLRGLRGARQSRAGQLWLISRRTPVPGPTPFDHGQRELSATFPPREARQSQSSSAKEAGAAPAGSTSAASEPQAPCRLAG